MNNIKGSKGVISFDDGEMEKVIKEFWKNIETVMRFSANKVLRLNIGDDAWGGLIQFVKFGVVGLINNAISYVIYIILIMVGIHYTLASIIGFTVSVLNSYYWNNKYVFKEEGSRIWWKTLIKTYISYAGTGIVLNNFLLFVWIDMLGISAMVAPLINLVITVPINFIMNKFWAYRK